MSSIDIIVVSYKTAQDLDEFLESLYLNQPADYDLFVYNVCPEALDIKVAERWLSIFPGIKNPANPSELRTRTGVHLQSEENIGYARAVNHAASMGSAEVIAIFNADIVLSENSVQRCADLLMAHKHLGALGPLQVNKSGLVVHPGIFGTNDNPQWRGWQVPVRDEWRDVREDAVTVSGSAYFTRRDVWIELTDCPIYKEFTGGAVGGFLPTELFYEETGFSYHLRDHGYKICFFGEVEIVHNWTQPSSEATSKIRASREMFRNFCSSHNIAHD